MKTKKSVFSNPSGLKSVLSRKAPIAGEVSVDRAPNRENKAALSNFIGVALEGALDQLEN